jgi:hypothetical protein
VLAPSFTNLGSRSVVERYAHGQPKNSPARHAREVVGHEVVAEPVALVHGHVDLAGRRLEIEATGFRSPLANVSRSLPSRFMRRTDARG